MKKLFLGSIALLVFSLSMAIFQMSCKKNIQAQTILTGMQQLNKIVYSKNLHDSSDGSYSGIEIWTANYDGSAQTRVNVTLPSGIFFGEGAVPILSPDGKKVFFRAGQGYNNQKYAMNTDIYSCNIDGSNVTRITTGIDVTEIGGAY